MKVGGLVAGAPVVDAHCHLLLAGGVDGPTFERCCTEADRFPPGVTAWDTPAGLAIRRWCAPVLDLAPFAPPEAYLERRDDLGVVEVSRRLMGAAGLAHLLVDTGLEGPDLCSPDTLAAAAGAPVTEVVRLERVAEDVARSGLEAGQFSSAYREALAARTVTAAAVKSIVAYRHGLAFDPTRPSDGEVNAAAGRWLASGDDHLRDPVLLRHVLWCGIDTGLPVQVHTGFGDRDLNLARSDPALLQPWLAAVESTNVPVVLLHCYPHHRCASWLAAVYPNVYVDVGLTVGQVGARAKGVLNEFFELAPFGKLLFSTDGYRLPELYLVGAAQFRHALATLLDGWLVDRAIDAPEAELITRMVAGGNAQRVYRLPACDHRACEGNG